jgi:hypothetical protein
MQYKNHILGNIEVEKTIMRKTQFNVEYLYLWYCLFCLYLNTHEIGSMFSTVFSN